MSSALIGYTGFVGGTLTQQTHFDALYHSKNIAEIRGKSYERVVCAGAPAAKWKANSEPDADRANLAGLMSHLEHVEARQFVLISTVDVYRVPVGVDEDTPIDTAQLEPYGLHRYELEQFCAGRFGAALKIVRLPGLFGAGLKKNFLYDMIHSGQSAWTHAESVFQFYDMSRLWGDLQTVMAADVALINFATEPVKSRDVAQHSFGVDYTHITEKPPVNYDMQTRHAALFGESGRYLASKETVYAQIAAFAKSGG